MQKFTHKIPVLLLFSRLILSFAIVIITFLKPAYSGRVVLLLMYTGILADIFDGIIARKFNISTVNFRLLDTIFDLFFYLSILMFVFSTHYLLIVDNLYLILIILTLEGFMYLFSLARFGKFPSPHAVMSKFWGLYIIVEFTLIIIGIQGNHFTIALFVGILAHSDRALIYILLPNWNHDIPSAYHALLLRQGIPIKRNSLFNG